VAKQAITSEDPTISISGEKTATAHYTRFRPASMTEAVLSLAATIPTGLAGVYISHSLGKYQDAWDPRLIGASKAEEELKRLLERA